jgi:glycosyltransferase involved in cell wall biosynthesis
MTPELMPSEFVGGNPHGRKLEMARRAEIVLAISEVTRRDLVQLVPDLKGRVYVTPLAVDSQFFERFASGESNRKRPYVLFVGDRCGYKNFRTFADAMVAVMREQDDISLVCVGGGPLNEAERAVFRREGLEKRLEWLTASDRELAALYGHAECFVFPSQYEGFGLPILEAMASGCPVVLSSTSCFPEVAEDAGEYFDPSSSESIVAAIRTVLGSKSRKRELRELGRSRLRAFSWEKTAELSARAFSQT